VKPKFYQHPSALVESASIGAGTRIWAFAHVMKGAKVGRNCNIGDHAFLESGVKVGNNVTIKNGVTLWDGVEIKDNVFIGPNAAFTNDLNPRSPRFASVRRRYSSKKNWLLKTVVGEGASIGCNATILCGINIGKFAMVGAGAVVTRNVPPHALVLGVPALVRGYVCLCGQRLNFCQSKARCAVCGETYKLIKNGIRHCC
jgi:acetyltransferase-like isoleucine patch superfamily enzyme